MTFKYLFPIALLGFMFVVGGAVVLGYNMNTPQLIITREVRVEKVEVPVGPEKLMDDLQICRQSLIETQEALNQDITCSDRICRIK